MVLTYPAPPLQIYALWCFPFSADRVCLGLGSYFQVQGLFDYFTQVRAILQSMHEHFNCVI